MLRAILFVFSLFLSVALRAGELPPELMKALDAFQTEGAKNWGFTQTTTSSSKSLVERYDPTKPEFSRWTLLRKDGHAATEDEIKEYNQMLTRRTPGQTAPNVKDQIRRETCEALGSENGRARYRFQLKAGGEEDKSAEHMAVIFSLHEASGAIERVELASIRPFSPMFSVKIEEARTVIDYTLPDENRPSLLREITVRVRGRAMFFKSLDEDMTVAYTDYVPPPVKR
jgi:hypothetical protein